METHRLVLLVVAMLCATIIAAALILRPTEPEYVDPDTGCPPPALLC